MQDIFGDDSTSVDQMVKSLSIPRLSKYTSATNGNINAALDLYRWNTKLSQAIYTYVQAWEVCFRNKMHLFLSWKYNPTWPYDKRFVRNLNSSDQKKVRETIDRQENDRKTSPVGTPAIVADLSAGFWVSQLSYDVAYSWRYNINRIFPHDNTVTSASARADCAEILGIRNRIAHHEPIFHLPLDVRHDEIRNIVSAMCKPTSRYADSMCKFREVFTHRP